MLMRLAHRLAHQVRDGFGRSLPLSRHIATAAVRRGRRSYVPLTLGTKA
jgi:hypothetical protein